MWNGRPRERRFTFHQAAPCRAGSRGHGMCHLLCCCSLNGVLSIRPSRSNQPPQYLAFKLRDARKAPPLLLYVSEYTCTMYEEEESRRLRAIAKDVIRGRWKQSLISQMQPHHAVISGTRPPGPGGINLEPHNFNGISTYVYITFRVLNSILWLPQTHYHNLILLGYMIDICLCRTHEIPYLARKNAIIVSGHHAVSLLSLSTLIRLTNLTAEFFDARWFYHSNWKNI